MTSPLYQPILGTDRVVIAFTHDLDRPVIILGDDRVMTARELRDAISRYQQVLEALEPRPLRAALLSKNRVEVPAIFYAVSFAGVVSTALHPMGSVEDYPYVLDGAGIDLLIYDDHFEDVAKELKVRAPGIRHFLAIGAEGRPQIKKVGSLFD